MCYSYDVSIKTFLLGTVLSIINLYIFKNNLLYIYLTLFWFFSGILMQLWESLLWKNINCRLVSNIAMINNILQPVMLIMLLFIPNYIRSKKINTKHVISIVVFYLLFVYFFRKKSYGCIKSDGGIHLKWWNVSTSIVYVITFVLLLSLLLDTRLALFQIGFFLGSLLVANIINGTSIKMMLQQPEPSRVASLWCWCVAFSPVYNYLVFKYGV